MTFLRDFVHVYLNILLVTQRNTILQKIYTHRHIYIHSICTDESIQKVNVMHV